MSGVRERRRQGVVLLNTRRRLYDGRPPKSDRHRGGVEYWRGSHEDWQVVRHVPKQQVWGHSRHATASRDHLVEYQMVATHKSGMIVTLTSWACGASTIVDVSLRSSNWPRCKRCEETCSESN